MMAKRWLATIYIIAASISCAAQTPHIASIKVMEWNVENLFDTRDDEGKEDEAFTPEGEYRWTRNRYWRKLTDISKVIAATSETDGMLPDLIGLCEVENDSVLHDLTTRSPLRNLYYNYVMTDSPDRRGIDVALLWQPGRFLPCSHQSIRVPSAEQELPSTRDILYVKGIIETRDTLHVLVSHMPSRLGGRTGDRNRELAASTLWHVVDSILQTPSPNIIVMGDFNATASDGIFRKAKLTITDPPHGGTYCFRGYWSCIDHILLSPSLSDKKRQVQVCELPWLLEDNVTTGGKQPHRTFRGPSYHGGVSDHLPLLMHIELP